MQYRTLGKTELNVSEIGYGGGRVRPEQDMNSLVNMIHYAIDCGVNFIDTAPNYGVWVQRNSDRQSNRWSPGMLVSSLRRQKLMSQTVSQRMWKAA